MIEKLSGTARNERGFAMIELMVTIVLLAIVTTGAYMVLFSLNEASTKTRNVAQVSQEARLSFNRMVRDTRQGRGIDAVDTNITDDGKVSYTVLVDFDGNNVISQPSPNPSGDYEALTYEFDRDAKTVTLNGEVLMRGAECAEPTCTVFSYSSSQMQYDWDENGVVTMEELDAAGCPLHGNPTIGNCNNTLDVELALISNVDFAFQISSGNSSAEFFVQAQLRNKS
jgi:prepilin-type N-terminal cleavage/methylation domain-containing protein